MSNSAVLPMPFNDAQLELMQLMAGGISDEAMKDLKKILLEFRANQISMMADKLLDKKGIFDSKTLAIEARKMKRSPYKSKKESVLVN